MHMNKKHFICLSNINKSPQMQQHSYYYTKIRNFPLLPLLGIAIESSRVEPFRQSSNKKPNNNYTVSRCKNYNLTLKNVPFIHIFERTLYMPWYCTEKWKIAGQFGTMHASLMTIKGFWVSAELQNPIHVF